MREIARISQDYFPTQDRIVRAVAKLFKLPTVPTGTFAVLDAGCGTGKAINDLREAWLTQRPDLNITLLGIESDKSRCQQGGGIVRGLFAIRSS